MSEPIGVGSWIECVRADAVGDVRVIVGVPYRVREVDPLAGPCTICGDEAEGLVLEGIELDGWAWCRCCFRPLGGDPQSITLTRLMDTPADPEQVTA